MSRTPNSTVASARPRRSPLAVRNRLSVKNKEDGYVYRIVNDVETRVQELQEQGYEIVPADKVGMVGDKRVGAVSPVGSSSHISVGQGVHAVVMRQKNDFYKEDQEIKQRQISEIEETTLRNAKRASDYGDISR